MTYIPENKTFQFWNSEDQNKLFPNEELEIDAQLENLSFEEFMRIFSLFPNDEDSTDENNFYEIKQEVPEISTPSPDTENRDVDVIMPPRTPQRRHIFSLSTSQNSSDGLIRRKRGRKAQKNKERIHDNYSSDNLLTKIQVHYLNFIINYLNAVLSQLDYKDTEIFIPLDNEFKKKINKAQFLALRTKKISDLLLHEKISPKFSTRHPDSNKILYNKIKDNEIIRKICDTNFFDFFKNIYYKSNYCINLENYGYGLILLSKKEVPMFDELLKKNTKGVNKYYQEKFEECAQQFYLKNN